MKSVRAAVAGTLAALALAAAASPAGAAVGPPAAAPGLTVAAAQLQGLPTPVPPTPVCTPGWGSIVLPICV